MYMYMYISVYTCLCIFVYMYMYGIYEIGTPYIGLEPCSEYLSFMTKIVSK